MPYKLKSVSTFIILIMVMSGFNSYAVSAKVDTASFIAAPEALSVAANPPPLGINLLQDPSFEGSYGSATGPWFQYPSDTICFTGTGLCDVNGAGYHSGGAWAGFGPQQSSFGYVWQDVTFPKCGATLEFHLYLGQSIAGWGLDNFFIALIDNTEVFRAYGFEMDSYSFYTKVSIPVNQFADGAKHRITFYGELVENFLYFNLDDVALYSTIPDPNTCAKVGVQIKAAQQPTFGIPSNAGERVSYPLNDGPVLVNSTLPLITSQRVISYSGGRRSHFSELMGLPENLESTKYAFPAYDNRFFDSQVRFANVGASTTTVRLYLGRTEMTSGCTPSNSPYTLAAGASLRVSCNVSGGPLVVESSGAKIVASVRVIFRRNGATLSFSELMGLPVSQFHTSYVFPAYNNASLNTQLRIANVGTSTTNVRLYIGRREMTSGCTPSNSPYTLASGTSLRISCAGVNDGPVRVTSTGVPIIASMRVARYDGAQWMNFSELMGLPTNQLDTTYLLPWYNNASLDTQLRFANVSSTPATVRVYIGGVEMRSGGVPSSSPYTLAAGASLRVSFPGVDRGPVEIVSNVRIVASERVIVQNPSTGLSFSELMGFPLRQLTGRYVFPAYNNLQLDTQLRFGVP